MLCIHFYEEAKDIPSGIGRSHRKVMHRSDTWKFFDKILRIHF